MIDYFEPAPTAEEETIRRIKGNYRRQFVAHSADEDGFDSVPPAWKEHDVSEVLKNFLQQQHPQARGGEDLPDLEDGEVEIARLSYTDSVHGEVTSLRARRGTASGQILLRMVDEYAAEITLARESTSEALTAEEVIALFREADPSPMDNDCEVSLTSFFYPDLDGLYASGAGE